MSFTDLAIAGFFLLNLYWGWNDGLIKKLLKVLFLIAGIYFGLNYANHFGNNYLAWLTSYSQVRAFIVFILILISLSIIQSILLMTIFKSLSDSLLNKILGLILGIIQGVIIISLFLAISEKVFSYNVTELVESSKILNLLSNNNLLLNKEIAKIF